MRKLIAISIFLWSHALHAQCDLNGILLELQATTELDGIIVGDGSCLSIATVVSPLSFSGGSLSLTTGDLTAGSSKVSIGGTGTDALLGPGASVDIVPANILLSTLGGSLNLSQLSTIGASNGQVIEFNGTAWVPGTDDGGSGTVTSVGLSLPTAIFDVTGSPVTTSGTLSATFDNQTANTVFAGPTSGGAATPAFRALVAADLPVGTNLWTDAGSFTYLTSTSDRVVIGNSLEVDPNYKLQVKNGLYSLGAGSTSSTYSAQFHNSTGGNNALVIRDDTRVGVGTASPARTFEVNGETRLDDLTTDDPTKIVGADADGDLGAIAVGSGLSLVAGTLTATAGATDLSFTGASSPVTLNSSTGTDVTFTAGGINSFSATGTNITITATEVDGSTSNELQTYSHSGTTTYTNTLSNGGGSWSITGAGIAVISQTAGAVTVTATEVDGSTTNEAWTIDGDDSDTEVIGNQTVKFQGAGIASTDYNPTTDVLLITATEVDGSTTNEGSLSVAAGGGNDSQIHSNTSGSTDVVISGGSGITVTEAGSTITIAATGGGTNYQTWRDDGAAATQRANANFVSTATIAFTLTDDAGNTETEVTANVPDDAITYAKFQNVSSGIILGRDDPGNGNVEELSPDATLVLNGTGNLGRAALTGDVTAAAGSNATTIANDAVTDAKLRNSAALSVIGRSANSVGDPADIAAAVDGQVLRRSGTSLGFGTVATAGIADDAVTYAKLQNAAVNNVLLGNNNGAGTDYEELTVANVYTMLGMSGLDQRIAIWKGANVIGNDIGLTFDYGNDRMFISDDLPEQGNGLAALNITNVGTDGSGDFLRMYGNMSGNLTAGQYNLATTSLAACIYTISTGGDGANDPILQWSIAGTGTASMGIDNSDANKLKISPKNVAPGGDANNGVIMTRDAVMLMGVNKDAPKHPLDIDGTTRAVQYLGTGNLWTSANIAFGTGAGTGPSLNSINGGNNFVTIYFTTGTAPVANGTVFTATFPKAFPSGFGTTVVFSADNTDVSATDLNKFRVKDPLWTNFIFKAVGTLAASTTYGFDFIIFGYDN